VTALLIADERSFMCEDHAYEADTEVETLTEQLKGAVEDRDALSVMLKRLLNVALVDGYGETVLDEAEALLARIEGDQR
jgi:hypothetical protein